MTTTPEDIIQAALWQGRYMGISNCREAAADILEALHEAGYAILASPLLDRIKREAAAEALEDWIQRLQLASENVGNLGLTISLAAVERDRLRGESE